MCAASSGPNFQYTFCKVRCYRSTAQLLFPPARYTEKRTHLLAARHGRAEAEEIELSTKLYVIVTADENSSRLPTVVSPLTQNSQSATKFTKKVKESDNKISKKTIGNGNNSQVLPE